MTHQAPFFHTLLACVCCVQDATERVRVLRWLLGKEQVPRLACTRTHHKVGVMTHVMGLVFRCKALCLGKHMGFVWMYGLWLCRLCPSVFVRGEF